LYFDSTLIKFYLDLKAFSHFAGLSHLGQFLLANRLATLKQNSDYHDWWQASTPAHLSGLESNAT
jgi:hypothetical protein